MSSQSISNQQLYDMIHAMREEARQQSDMIHAMREETRQQFELVHKKLDFHDQQFQSLRDEIKDIRGEIADVRSEVRDVRADVGEVRTDIAALQDTRLRWNGSILALVTACSSVLTLILLRLLNVLGLRLAESGGGIV